MGWEVLIGIATALAAAWLLLLIALLIARPKGSGAGEALRILPDTLKLLRRLATDPRVPRGVRIGLWLLIAYLLFPLDLVPDFLPVIGYADDAIIAGVALRLVIRHAGADAVRRHWSGTEDGLAAVWKLAGLPGEPPVTPVA
ncbi:MAG: DUF1232 domain-containing protein [Actinomycetota bacterium]